MQLGGGYSLRMGNKLLQFRQPSSLCVSLTQKTSACFHLKSYAQPTPHIYITLAPVARSSQPLSRPPGRKNGEDKVFQGDMPKAC